jgi:hypothetical protein
MARVKTLCFEVWKSMFNLEKLPSYTLVGIRSHDHPQVETTPLDHVTMGKLENI